MKKIWLSILALILIAWIIYAGYFFLEEKRVKDYSTACMDKVREEIWNEYLWNIALIDSEKVDGVYHYFWMCSDETSDYYFSCAVTNKDNVDVKIEVDEVPDDFDGCNNYFDGCNRCSMQDDWEIVCTELACEEYQEAYCADEPVVDEINVPAFEELNQAITLCHVDDMWWYDINVTKMAYILPYKDWYIGFWCTRWMEFISYLQDIRKSMWCIIYYWYNILVESSLQDMRCYFPMSKLSR